MTEIAGRVAIVTGAASGIGRGTALALGRAGARMVVADIDLAGAEAVATSIRDHGGVACASSCDVSADTAFEALRVEVLDRFGQVDIIMNNAGVIVSGHPEDIPVEEWARVLNVNLMSVVRSNAAFLPLLLAQRSGHIVNTASFVGLYGYSFDRLPYAASKAAIVQLSEGLALYLRPKGISVTLLCPGPVATNIMRSMRVWTEGVRIRGPGREFGLMTSDEVGDLVVDAIRRDVFFLPTDARVRERMVRRAGDFDAHLRAQLDDPHLLDIPPLTRSYTDEAGC
ncbi:MAG: SDR family oxidoreductase [Janthinobacterium lividum]